MTCSFITITTNVGSIHSLPHLGPNWIWSIQKLIFSLQPDVAAIHLQEAHDLDETDFHNLVQQLLAGSYRQGYVTHFVYFDEGSCGEFTALGLIYLFSRNLSTVQLWNYTDNKFAPYTSEMSLSSKKEEYIEKHQFPSNLFPSGFRSRKGMIRSRWKLFDHVLEFVNLHLFHDLDNLQAIKEHPNIYSKCRAAGLNWVLDRIGLHEDSDATVFLFGDFNFRVNLSAFIKHLLQAATDVDSVLSIEQTTPQPTGVDSMFITSAEARAPASSSPVQSVIEYYRVEKDSRLEAGRQKLALSVARKLFAPTRDDHWFSALEQLIDFDEERQAFDDRLYELPIDFPPSYPVETGEGTGSYRYASTRCPAWPDRVLMSRRARSRICPPHLLSRPAGAAGGEDLPARIVYSSLGTDKCTGDHRPVYLHFGLSAEPDRFPAS